MGDKEIELMHSPGMRSSFNKNETLLPIQSEQSSTHLVLTYSLTLTTRAYLETETNFVAVAAADTGAAAVANVGSQQRQVTMKVGSNDP